MITDRDLPLDHEDRLLNASGDDEMKDVEPAGVSVKALEWHDRLKRGEREGFVCSENSPISYSIMLSCFRVYGVPGPHDGAEEYGSLSEAKAAAQADFASRILSCIEAGPGEVAEDMEISSISFNAMEADEEDLASDDRWNAGVNYSIERLCEILGVDPKAISWDAATETLDGDVMSVICNVMVAAYGEEWSSNERGTAIVRAALSHNAGSADGSEALPMQSAPKDGSMLRLFVQFDGDSSVGAFEDADTGWTIGTNNLANTGEDEWEIAGWDWEQDTYRQARTANPIGWLPFHSAALSPIGGEAEPVAWTSRANLRSLHEEGAFHAVMGPKNTANMNVPLYARPQHEASK